MSDRSQKYFWMSDQEYIAHLERREQFWRVSFFITVSTLLILMEVYK